MKILLLGGTTEAAALARLLASDGRFDATLSLAGRTKEPAAVPLKTRVGGFGGVAGLASYLSEKRIDVLVDATHPYAAQMSRNAVEASTMSVVALLSLRRPPWPRQAGDRWVEVPDAEAAALAIGPEPRRVFLAMGRQELHAFARAPQHDYLIRSVDHPGRLPLPRAEVITARGPFDATAEEALLREHGIEILVSKNSGGSATYGKIEAARRLALPVIMLARPELPFVESLASAEAALTWLAAHHEAGARRGV